LIVGIREHQMEVFVITFVSVPEQQGVNDDNVNFGRLCGLFHARVARPLLGSESQEVHGR
jgi:hypothetical protein